MIRSERLTRGSPWQPRVHTGQAHGTLIRLLSSALLVGYSSAVLHDECGPRCSPHVHNHHPHEWSASGALPTGWQLVAVVEPLHSHTWLMGIASYLQ